MKYFFEQPYSPTTVNLARYLGEQGFSQAAELEQAQFTERQLCLDEDKTIYLEYKHLLGQLVMESGLSLMPLTYGINDENYQQVLSVIPEGRRWIIKPSMMNNGQGIFLLSDKMAIRDHFQQMQRYGGDHVLQAYIEPPHLLNGHKYSLRFFVVLTNFAGAYFYPHGYLNVAKETYVQSFDDPLCHLTNEHLRQDGMPNVYQVPTVKIPNFDVVLKQLVIICKQVLGLFKTKFPRWESQTGAFSIFGFDFLMDQQLQPWLLEVNHGPCFPEGEHILQEILYQPFWRAIVKEIILPMMQQQSLNQGASFIDVTQDL